MTVVSNATVNTTANTGSEETASSIKIEDTSLEARFADMYSKEVAKISPGKIKIDSLVNKYLEGDDSIRNILVEQHLKLVITISDQFDGHGVRKADLIQEGNLGLIEAVDSYKKEFQNTFSHKDSDEPAPFNQYIISAISKSMQNLVDMETGNSHIGEHLVERVNALSRATEDLAEKHGRPATLKELCEYLSLSEDEVLTVMKISLDALTLNEEDGQQ